jgi:hypothetical protein
MPPLFVKLNALLLIGGLLAGCTRKLDITVELYWPETPDPFERLETVRMTALVGGQTIVLGEDRWDQGAIELPTGIDPSVERLVVEGLSGGEVISSGASGPLDLLGEPPDGALRIQFSRVGVLSLLSDRGPVRRRGQVALPLQDGRVLFLGGRDENGCMVESTEVVSLDGIEPGPPIMGGRAGDFYAGLLPDGRALVIGGEVAPDCGATRLAEDVAIIDVVEGTARIARVSADLWRPGSAVAAVSSALAIIGGGDGDPLPSSAVHRFSPTTLEFNQIGNLESPRTDASAAAISDQRVLFVGGRSNTSTQSALDSATVFVPEAGAPLTDQIRLGRRVIAPAVITLRSGAVIAAGGIGADGSAADRIDSIVVRTEREFPIGDTSTVTVLPQPIARGRLTELQDGSLLLLPEANAAPQWIRFLPSRAVAIDPVEGVAGPFAGARTTDGRALLRSEEGVYLSFNPGPSAALGVYGAGGDLSAGPHELAIVPLRPASWERTEEGLAGFRAAPPGNLVPEELAVLSDRSTGDFEISFDLALEGLAKAAIAFGMEDDRFDYVVLAGASFVERALAGQSRGKVACTAAETRVLAEPGFHRVRVARRGGRVRLDVGADGTDELLCDTPRPEAGRIALAIVTGRATFNRVELR